MKLALALQPQETTPRVPVALLTGTLESKIARGAQLRADGIELMPVAPAELDGRAIGSLLRGHGLAAAAIGSGAIAFATGLTLLNPDKVCSARARDTLQELIDLAHAVGAPLVTLGSFRGRLAGTGESGHAALVSVVREAATYAAERGIRLVIEPLNRYETDVIVNLDQALEFLDRVAHPSLGILLDTFHVNIEEDSITEPFRRAAAAGRLWHVHLGDNQRRWPGSGHLDFSAIVHTLRDVGYSGYLSAELLALPDPDTAALKTLEFMRTLLQETQ